MNILIVNLHSALNLGDDAITLATLRGLRELYPTANITLAANDPESWHKYAADSVRILPSMCTWVANCRLGEWRRRLLRMPVVALLLLVCALVYRLTGLRFFFGSTTQRALQKEYYQADLVLSCGGGNFYAHHAKSPALVWALITPGYAIALGKRTLMLPQSIGPITGKIQRKLAQLVFRRMDCIMLRERQSERFFTDVLGLDRPVFVLPDLAFALDGAQTSGGKAEFIHDERTSIGVTMIDRHAQDPGFTRQEQYEDAVIQALLELNRRTACHVYLFIQCTGPSPDHDDRLISARMAERLKPHLPVTVLGPYPGAVEIKAAYQAMDVILGSRLHTAIFAISLGKPFALIGYQPKGIGVLELFGLGDACVDIGALSEKPLAGMLEHLLDDRRGIENNQQIISQHARTWASTWKQQVKP